MESVKGRASGLASTNLLVGEAFKKRGFGMLRKWLLSSSMVTESRFCQEMLIEGQILDNSIRHCFQNCLHPPSWTLSPLKRRGVLQLLFLAKAASHKLYYNYRSDDDFYHLGHLGHTWSWPSTFKLSVKGRIHTHLSLTPSHLPASFFVTQIFFLFHLLLVNNIQVMTGAGRTLNLLFSASKYAAFQNSFPDRIWLRLRTAWGFKKYIKK